MWVKFRRTFKLPDFNRQHSWRNILLDINYKILAFLTNIYRWSIMFLQVKYTWIYLHSIKVITIQNITFCTEHGFQYHVTVFHLMCRIDRVNEIIWLLNLLWNQSKSLKCESSSEGFQRGWINFDNIIITLLNHECSFQGLGLWRIDNAVTYCQIHLIYCQGCPPGWLGIVVNPSPKISQFPYGSPYPQTCIGLVWPRPRQRQFTNDYSCNCGWAGYNSLAPGRSWCDFKNVIFNLALLIGIFKSSFYANLLWWMPLGLTDDKSALVQVMAWCRQATSHYLNQGWPRSPTPYSVTRPQCSSVDTPSGIGDEK